MKLCTSCNMPLTGRSAERGFHHPLECVQELKKALACSTEQCLLKACQAAYKKHHLNDDSIGWTELSDILMNALCNAMGDEAFCEWLEKQ